MKAKNIILIIIGAFLIKSALTTKNIALLSDWSTDYIAGQNASTIAFIIIGIWLIVLGFTKKKPKIQTKQGHKGKQHKKI